MKVDEILARLEIEPVNSGACGAAWTGPPEAISVP